jgi:hypothetical protein
MEGTQSGTYKQTSFLIGESLSSFLVIQSYKLALANKRVAQWVLDLENLSKTTILFEKTIKNVIKITIRISAFILY